MNIHDGSSRAGHDDAFDRAMRELHAQALTQVSPRTRAHLRAARTAADRAPSRGVRWALASGLVAVVALAIGLQQWRATSYSADAPPRIAAGDATDIGAVATLDENPDFYLWLASNDDTLPATWER